MSQLLQPLAGLFNQLYGSEPDVLERQTLRYQRLINMFQEHFAQADVKLFSTPGRTEIGGNHTDHNHGRVLAGSVNLDAVAAAAANNSREVNIYSEGYKAPFHVNLDQPEIIESEKGSTTSLIRGIGARMEKLGFKTGGFNACMISDVLPGSGLSSSAAIEVLIGTLFNSLFNENKIPPDQIAIIGQYAENRYFGKPCGLMDQMTCAVGGIVTIDFEDTTKPIVRKVNFDFSAQDYRVAVVDTGGNHADLTDDYASVPIEMKSVARALGQEVCRQISLKDLLIKLPEIRQAVGDRAVLRALHFLGDNQRVIKQVEALENGKFQQFLNLVNDSGSSSFKWLQNIYTTKNVREQGVSLALAMTEVFIHRSGGACRVHGGGFAGTIQVFLPNGVVGDYVRFMEPVFGKNSVMILKIRSQGTLQLK